MSNLEIMKEKALKMFTEQDLTVEEVNDDNGEKRYIARNKDGKPIGLGGFEDGKSVWWEIIRAKLH